jgi:exodeoxyribonuclease-5
LFEIYSGHFYDHGKLDKERADRDWKNKRGLVEATFGWAITCHKAQGSQWQNVIVFDDRLSRTAEDRKRWLYTALTRAEEGLVILD